jgi:hypothetical protein
MKRLSFAGLLAAGVCGLFSSPLAALPDLTLQSSDIQFSMTSPEVTEVITISATIRNTGTAYHDQVVLEPVKKHDIFQGTDQQGSQVSADNSLPQWWGNKYLSTQTFYIGKASFRVRDIGADDEVVLEIRNTHPTANPPIPATGSSELIEKVIVNSTNTTTPYEWQDFILNTPVQLTANATYWFCIENFNTTGSDGYGVWRDSGTASNEVVVSQNVGTGWIDRSSGSNSIGRRILFHRIYRPQDTIVRVFQGDPDAGGSLLSISTISLPIAANGSTVVSTTWSATTAGPYDIFIQVDGPGLISEANEGNNKVSRAITVIQTQANIAETSAPDGVLGINPAVPLTFTFNKAMNGGTLAGAFSLRATRDDMGNTISEAVNGNPAYDAASKTFTFTPSSPLKNNTRYEAKWTDAAKDYLGFSLSPYTAIFHTAVQKSVQNIILGTDQQTKLVLSPDSVPYENYFIDLDVSPPADSAVQTANSKAGRDRDAFTSPIGSSLRRARLYQGTYPGTEVSSPEFSANVSLTVPYSDDGNGIVAGTNPPVRETSLSLYWLNEEDGLWVRLPDSTVDTAQNTVTATVPHLSYFVLMGLNAPDLSRAYAYPVPFRPNAGLGHSRIKFTGLSPQCVIKIYTVTGELVKSIEESDGDGFNDTWDASDVASGTYLYVIDNATERKTGQLVIIK